jgi:hypothetical protein
MAHLAHQLLFQQYRSKPESLTNARMSSSTGCGHAGSRLMCEKCRFCCKSLFALAIKNSFGCTRDFRVNMWGTSLPDDKLAGHLGNVIGATSIGGRRSEFFTARKLAPGNLGLLQQYLPIPDSRTATKQSHCAAVNARPRRKEFHAHP